MKMIHIVVAIHNDYQGQEKIPFETKTANVTIWKNACILSIQVIVNGVCDV